MHNYYLHLSQGQLNLLEICPPQFQKVYLERLGNSWDLEKEKKRQWGSQFHLLMQQFQLGIITDSFLDNINPELCQSFQALIRKTADIWHSKDIISKEAEHRRMISHNNYILTVIYDLLVCYKDKAIIYDWKTYLQPEKAENLANNWQTKLYLYVLAETSPYQPEDICFTYWFVKLPENPQCLTFNYNQKLHQKTKQDLNKVLAQLQLWLDQYREKQVSFPHKPNCHNSCPYYLSFYWGANQQKQSNALDWLNNVNNIEEIKI
jgi:hypothetical protein